MVLRLIYEAIKLINLNLKTDLPEYPQLTLTSMIVK
jgi:hypothetical protein